MKNFQFSLSSIFAITVVVGVLLAFVDRLASESFLLAIWLTTFFLSYVNAPQPGWNRVWRVTAITSAAWTVCIFGTHLMYVSVPGKSANVLVWRVVHLVAIGAAAALLSALVLNGIVATVRRWFQATWRGKFLSAAAILGALFSGWTGWNSMQSRYWQPVVVPIRSAPSFDTAFLDEVARRHSRISASPDGSLIATIESGGVVVYDTDTRRVVTVFPGAKDNWFVSAGFLRDNSHLAAVRRQGRDDWSLDRWDIAEWKLQDPMPLTELLAPAPPGMSVPILVDGILLLVSTDNRDKTKTKVRLKTVDPLAERWQAEEFASAIIDDGANNPLVMDWTVSPNGNWIASGRWSGGYGEEWVFGRGTGARLRMPGHLWGFLPDGDRMLISERTDRIVWHKGPRSPVVEPPFWNHLNPDRYIRVSIFDCVSNRVSQQSGWWRNSAGGAMKFDGSRVLVTQKDACLIWNVPQNAEHAQSP